MADDPSTQLRRLRRLALIVLLVGVIFFVGGLVAGVETVQLAGLGVMALGVVGAGAVLYRAARLSR